MELSGKGSSVAVELGKVNDGVKQCLVKLKWSTAADFDLAAIYEGKDGTVGMVYFNNLGDLNAFPFMKLSGDEGVGDTVAEGGNEEKMTITKLSDMAKVHIVAWDYGMLEVGGSARFKDSDVKITVMDDSGTEHEVTLDSNEMSNVAIVATIDNTSPMGATITNSSKVGVLKGLSSTDQFMTIINS